MMDSCNTRRDDSSRLQTNGAPVIKKKPSMVYPRDGMGEDETNTNPRYGYEDYPRG